MKTNFVLLVALFLVSSCSSAPEYISEDNKNIFIKSKIDAAVPHYRKCYETHMRNKIDKGVARVSFIIKKSGELRDVKTTKESGRLNKLILECMTNISKNLNFPPSSMGEIQINQPINFFQGTNH